MATAVAREASGVAGLALRGRRKWRVKCGAQQAVESEGMSYKTCKGWHLHNWPMRLAKVVCGSTTEESMDFIRLE